MYAFKATGCRWMLSTPPAAGLHHARSADVGPFLTGDDHWRTDTRLIAQTVLAGSATR